MSKRTYWAGYESGVVNANECADGYAVPGYHLEVFTTRAAARARYQDVRRVRIVEVKRAKRRSKP